MHDNAEIYHTKCLNRFHSVQISKLDFTISDDGACLRRHLELLGCEFQNRRERSSFRHAETEKERINHRFFRYLRKGKGKGNLRRSDSIRFDSRTL